MALVECRSCHKKISEKAHFCPKCGAQQNIENQQLSTPKEQEAKQDKEENKEQSNIINSNAIASNNKKQNGIGLVPVLIVTVIIVFLFIILIVSTMFSNIKSQREKVVYDEESFTMDTMEDEQSEAETQQQLTVEENKAVEPDTQWKYSTKTDPMTDKITHYADIYSENTNYIYGGDTQLGINISYEEGSPHPIVLMGLGSWCTFRDYFPLLYYRFDGGEMEKQAYKATAKNVIFIGTEDWVNKLKNSKKLACKIELADGSTATFTFDTSGLKWDYGLNTKKPVGDKEKYELRDSPKSAGTTKSVNGSKSSNQGQKPSSPSTQIESKGKRKSI